MSDTDTFVYVVGPRVGPQKVGIARDVEDRKGHVQVGCPFVLVTHHTMSAPKTVAAAIERLAHARLAPYWQRGEWFNVTPAIAIGAVESAARVAQRGADAPRSVRDMDGIEWLLRYASFPRSLLEAAVAYRELAEFCARGSQCTMAGQAEDYGYRKMADATSRLRAINESVIKSAGEAGLRALIATAHQGELPQPGAERELVRALNVVEIHLDTAECA